MRLPSLIFIIFCCVFQVNAQERIDQIRSILAASIVDHPGLDGTVELSVSGTSIAEFVRALGMTHELNLTIEPGIEANVYNNFSNAKVSDVLIYLCKQYDLEVEVIGSIVALRKYVPPPEEVIPIPTKQLGVTWNPDENTIDLDLRNDSLSTVIRAMNLASGENIILAPDLGGNLISLFVRDVNINDALDKLAFSNALTHEETNKGEHRLLRGTPEQATTTEPRRGASRNTSEASQNAGSVFVETQNDGTLSIEAQNTPITTILEELSLQSGRNYFILDPVDITTSLYVEGATYEELLEHLLRGTELTHQTVNGVVLIGNRNKEGLRRTELVRLKNRPVTSILEVIPTSISENIEIKEFIELNGLILSGGSEGIQEIKRFLHAIDQVVPVVMIEVIIVDVNKSRSLNTGIQVGVGGGPTSSGGTLLPGANYDLTSGTVNSLINSFNGFGLFNLGNVTSDFYLSIQALETDGYLKTRSTPQLSTLNGHEATLSIGETEYYLEVQNNIIGSQNPTVTSSQIYKPVNADLAIAIKPVVSSEDVVTLEIEVTQSNFTARISETAPPGNVERSFNSIIRVRDRDMIILGGLDEKEQSRSGSGLPFIARIPILKWFFGSRSLQKGKSKLTIFIRPTIIH